MAHLKKWWIIGILDGLSGDVANYRYIRLLILRCGGSSGDVVAYQEIWWIIGILGDLSGDVVDCRNIR